MSSKFHDTQEFAPIYATFNVQRALGVGIVALAATPLFRQAALLWNGPAREAFLLAITLLTLSVAIAQGSLSAHRGLAIQHALYGNVRRKKELAFELHGPEPSKDLWQSVFEPLDQEDKQIAVQAGQEFVKVLRWLSAQYASAVFGALAVIVALILTPGT